MIDEEENKQNVVDLNNDDEKMIQEEDSFVFEHLRTLCLNTNALLTS